MRENILLRKTCSIYANDLHFATVIFPFIRKELKNNTTIRTILEKDEDENIEKVISNVSLNSEIEEKIKTIDWKRSNINKIKQNFKYLEEDTNEGKQINLIIKGSNIFIQKVNKAIDLWVKNNFEKLEKNNTLLNVINCFSFQENNKVDEILENHDYILKTAGIEEIIENINLLKAN